MVKMKTCYIFLLLTILVLALQPTSTIGGDTEDIAKLSAKNSIPSATVYTLDDDLEITYEEIGGVYWVDVAILKTYWTLQETRTDHPWYQYSYKMEFWYEVALEQYQQDPEKNRIGDGKVLQDSIKEEHVTHYNQFTPNDVNPLTHQKEWKAIGDVIASGCNSDDDGYFTVKETGDLPDEWNMKPYNEVIITPIDPEKLTINAPSNNDVTISWPDTDEVKIVSFYAGADVTWEISLDGEECTVNLFGEQKYSSA